MYTNKSDIALQSAYEHLADNLNAKIKQDANQAVFVEICVDDELKKDFTNKRSKDYEEFLVAHYENACFWLNTWLLIMGGLVGIITFIVPLLLARSHEKKMKEIDKDFNLLKDDTKEKIKQADDLKNKTYLILEKAEEAQRKAEEAQSITAKAQGIVEDAQKKIEEDRKRTEEAQKRSKIAYYNSIYLNGINETYRLIDKKEFDAAKKRLLGLERLESLNDKNKAEIKATYALIYWENNNLENAIDFYKQAISLDRNNSIYYKGIGTIYRELDENELALDALMEAEKLSPNDTQTLWQIVYIYRVIGDSDKEEFYIDKIEKLSPNDPNQLNDLADFLIQEGKLNEAKSKLFSILKKASTFTVANNSIFLIYSNLGFIYFLEGDDVDAYNYIYSSKNYRPEFSFNLFILALLYLKDGKFEKGMPFLDKFIEREEIDINYTQGSFVENKLREVVSNIIFNNKGNKCLKDKLDKALELYSERTIPGKSKKLVQMKQFCKG